MKKKLALDEAATTVSKKRMNAIQHALSFEPRDYEQMPYPWNLRYNYLQGSLHALVVVFFIALSKYGDFFYVLFALIVILIQRYVVHKAHQSGREVFLA
jgi:hypothetical protein